jgi:hypothetical protein
MTTPTNSLRLALVAALLTPLPGPAQSIPSPYRFVEAGQEGGLFAGWFAPGTGQFDLGPEAGPIVGGRYAIRVGGPISLEGTATVMPTTRAVIDPAREEGQRRIDEADALMASLDARLKFSVVGQRTWNDLAPYVTAGAGFVFDAGGDQPEDRQLAVDDRFEFGASFLGVLGAGTRWLPSESFALRADVDLRIWQLETPRGFRFEDRFPDAPQEEWVSGLSFSVGASYLF